MNCAVDHTKIAINADKGREYFAPCTPKTGYVVLYIVEIRTSTNQDIYYAFLVRVKCFTSAAFLEVAVVH